MHSQGHIQHHHQRETQHHTDDPGRLISVVLGFALMMALDVAL